MPVTLPDAITSRTEAETIALGTMLAPLLEPDDVVALSGDLGAGKTCLTKGVAAGLGVAEHVTSPTFNIMLEHHGRLELYHFDLYRLERADQLEDIDFFATLEAGGACIIEWGERFPAAMPEDYLAVEISIAEDDTRHFTLVAYGPRGERLANAWLSAVEAGTVEP
ncbi:MAG: tRNA (adenosine(37)-N6)-threonylcarbamoyltransferase complex ATPase subunit type 1 TsaE [Actinobacteria bacterium HGW-Actinobacteria-1]|jgi:tRNA threonylcarbamoyladenosine biosynthesis protein TsaE|nr:MAG: tRNA (adenosine(37)-N6)-threonylcarbamoyltransferase complex ATPase subunit type 1 TsaE [Actinobacteria bacterium HGW-Actinobacteria-1]